jgi:hypothetical protein
MWTEALDVRLLGLRAMGMSWEAIAQSLSVSRSQARERGRRLGAQARTPLSRVAMPDARDRPARPPGHPQCWNLINAGTVLEGEPYPFPVFL